MTEHLSVAGATHQCSLEISVSDSNKIRLRGLTKQSLLYLFRDPEKGAHRAARRLQSPERAIVSPARIDYIHQHENPNNGTDFVSPVHSGRREHEYSNI